MNPIWYGSIRAVTNKKEYLKIRITTKIIIIDNLIILIYIFKIYSNINILMFFILINIYLHRHFLIYYQLVSLTIASLVLQIYYSAMQN